MLDDLGLDDVGVRRSRLLAAEVDRDHLAGRGAAEIGRRQSLQRAVDPLRGRRGEIEIAVDALGDALGAERGEALVDLLADAAEIRIGGVAERQHAELDAVEARRALAHQFVVDARGAARRLAFAPGGGDDDEALR